MRRIGRDSSGFSFVIVVGIILIILLASVIILFLPLKEIQINETRESGSNEGLENLDFNIVSSLGRAMVLFEDDPDDLVTLNVSGSTRVSPIAGDSPVRVSWDQRTEGNTLVIVSEVKVDSTLLALPNLNITITISKQLRTNLSVLNTLGELEMIADGDVRLQDVSLRSSTGDVKVHVLNGTTLEGNMTVRADTGAIGLIWKESTVNGSGSMDIRANVGGINVNISQTEELGGDLPIDILADVGGIGLIMDITGNNSARVLSEARLGDVSILSQEGFSGSGGSLSSSNYPDDWVIDIDVEASVGGIDLDLLYSS